MNKRCGKCKKELPIEQFNKNKAKSDGLAWSCRECQKQTQKEYYATHPKQQEIIKAKTKTSKENAQEYVYNYCKTHPCIDCNENRIECLEFDHQRDKIDNISNMVSDGRSIATIQKEIDKCDVVCANCHRIRTAKQQGWYSWISALGEES